MVNKKAEFFDELCDLLEKYNVDISAESETAAVRVRIDFNELGESVFTRELDVNFCALVCKDIKQEDT